MPGGLPPGLRRAGTTQAAKMTIQASHLLLK